MCVYLVGNGSGAAEEGEEEEQEQGLLRVSRADLKLFFAKLSVCLPGGGPQQQVDLFLQLHTHDDANNPGSIDLEELVAVRVGEWWGGGEIEFATLQ
jgi:hypothetical protein